jgi:hypothetical protein
MAGPDYNSFSATNISATTAAFTLNGGKFMLDAHSAAWGGGNAQMTRLAADGSTYVNVGSSITADGTATYDLAPGSYKLAVTTVTGLYVSLTRIPYDGGR